MLSNNSSTLPSVSKQPYLSQRDSTGGGRVSQEDSICMDAKTRGQRMKLKELTEPVTRSSRISSNF